MTLLLKVAWLGPLLLGSTMLWVVLLGVVPAALAWVLSLGGLCAMAVLATGALEELSLRIFLPARRLSEVEVARLGPVLGPLEELGFLIPSTTPGSANRTSGSVLVQTGIRADPAAVEFVGRRRGASKRGAGRRTDETSDLAVTDDRTDACRGTVLLSPAFVEAVFQGELSHYQLQALVMHAVGRHRAARQRHLVLCGLWLLPWRAVAGLARATGRVFGRGGGATSGAWTLRGFVGVVVLVRAVGDLESGLTGRAVAGFAGACFVAATYIVPAAHHAWRARLSRAGDRLVAHHRLAALNPRSDPVVGERFDSLAEDARTVRRLYLVRD